MKGMQINKSKNRILFIIGTMTIGGAERQLVNLINFIDRINFKPILFLTRAKEGEFLKLLKKDIHILTFPEKLNYLKVFLPGLLLFLKSFYISKIVKRLNINIIYSRVDLNNLMAFIAGKFFTKTRLVVCESSFPSSSFFYHQRKFSFIQKYLFHYMYNHADYSIANSIAARDDLFHFYKLNKNKRVLAIYNSLDFAFIESKIKNIQSLEFDRNRIVLSFVGRLIKSKGLQHLFKALLLLNKSKLKCQVLLVGDGPYRHELETLCNDYNIKDQVNFLGFMEDPYQVLKKSHIFIFPSLHEGMPGALIEALICEVPIIAALSSGGTKEVLQDGELGLLVPPADPESIARAIEDVVMHYEDFKKQAISAKIKAKAIFSIEKMVKEYEKIFFSLLQ